MSSHTDASVAPGLVRDTIPFSRFSWIRPLVHAYATDYASVASLFPGDPGKPETWRAAVARVQQQRPAARPIAPILIDQLRARSAPPAAIAAAELIARPESVAIVTGQQAGLFGGPLYTLLKAATTVRLARHVSEICQVPVVPVFWVDAEDHDWEEVRSNHLLDRDLNLASVTLPDLPGAGVQPVGRLTLDDRVSDAVSEWMRSAPPSEYTPWLQETLAAHYRPGARFGTAFAGLLDALLGPSGLVVFEADDARAKPIVAPLFVSELDRPCGAAHGARDGAATMQALGHAPQIQPGDDVVSLFYLDGQGRRSLRYRDGAFVVGDERRAPAELVAEAGTHPERFSPNVLLRPLVQDSLFPTVCYVGGPSELAYQVQLRNVYPAFRLEPPLLVSRASATLVDSAAIKFLEKHGLPLETLQPQDESALNRLLEQLLPPALEATIADLERDVLSRADALKRIAESVDPTLAGAVDTTVDRVRDTVKNLHGKIVQAAKRKDDTLRRQFTRTRALAFPGGHPQERLLGGAFFLNRYGPGLAERLIEAAPPIPTAHLVLTP